MKSYCSASSGARSAMAGPQGRPEPPGPPGFTSAMPWRSGLPFEVSVLATRRVMVWPSSGFFQSRGTVTSAHAVPGIALNRALRRSLPKSQASQSSVWPTRCGASAAASLTLLPRVAERSLERA